MLHRLFHRFFQELQFWFTSFFRIHYGLVSDYQILTSITSFFFKMQNRNEKNFSTFFYSRSIFICEEKLIRNQYRSFFVEVLQTYTHPHIQSYFRFYYIIIILKWSFTKWGRNQTNTSLRYLFDLISFSFIFMIILENIDL